MLKQSFQFFTALLALSLFVACGPDGETVASGEADTNEGPTTATAASYSVDGNASIVNWEGTKLAYGHTGTINVSQGDLAVSDGKIVGGVFTMNMATLTNTDQEGESKDNLEGHLKSPDFFDIENYPTATFEIKNVVPANGRDDITHMVTGNLTMKDSTRSVSIPANIEMTADQIVATTPDFVINRYEWGISYGSGLSGAIGDNVINDNVGLQINLVAKK